MRIFAIVLFIIGPHFLFSQKTFDSIKDSIVDLDDMSDEKLKNVVDNIYTFREKGLDSTDIKILLSGPLFGTFLVKIANKKPTYLDLYNEFILFQKSPSYIKIYTTYEVTARLENTKANYRNWDRDKELFTELNIPEEELEKIRLYVEKNSDTSRTYKVLLTEYKENKRIEDLSKAYTLFDFKQAINIDSLLIESKKQNKPIFLYFTGYNCVNCRKIEQSLLIKDEISSRLSDEFIFISLYADNKKLLPEENWYFSKSLDRKVKTVGDMNADYQISNFQSNSQPTFICLNSENKLIGKADYTFNEVKKFNLFLNDCLEKF